MTVEAQRPTGNPGTAPRGPAGPHPEPTRPDPNPRQPIQPVSPSTPPPSKGILLAADDWLASVEQVLARSLPDPADQVEACGQAILTFRLKRARAAVADLLAYDSGRGGQHIAAAVAPRPVEPPAGQKPPLSGGAFLLPRDVRIGARQ